MGSCGLMLRKLVVERLQSHMVWGLSPIWSIAEHLANLTLQQDYVPNCTMFCNVAWSYLLCSCVHETSLLAELPIHCMNCMYYLMYAPPTPTPGCLLVCVYVWEERKRETDSGGHRQHKKKETESESAVSYQPPCTVSAGVIELVNGTNCPQVYSRQTAFQELYLQCTVTVQGFPSIFLSFE